MSTRATYRFKGKYHDHTIYIHHDGYPQGAAYYFYRMLMLENHRGTFAERMIRANDGAELTKSHDYHGDTNYRYTIDDDRTDAGCQIKVSERHWSDTVDGQDQWKIMVDAPSHLDQFIDKYIDREWVKSDDSTYYPFIPVEQDWYNYETAGVKIMGEHGGLPTLRIWSTHKNNMGSESANYKSLYKRIKMLAESFGMESVLSELAELKEQADSNIEAVTI